MIRLAYGADSSATLEEESRDITHCISRCLNQMGRIPGDENDDIIAIL